MAFRGLFIGVNHYASADVNRLQCAVRDATALHALFADILGGDAVLLRDEEAAKEGLTREFGRLRNTSADDVVVVAFSGHGSDTHEVVTYDADMADPPGTCIPLGTLTGWFSQIPTGGWCVFSTAVFRVGWAPRC